jgi:nicotinamide-nucleotide amidase
MNVSDSALNHLASEVVSRLSDASLFLATAESCTGGWVAKLLTDITGSSAVLERGFVTYSNDAKQELLGVPQSLIVEHGAVSEACVKAMVSGALRQSRAQIAVAVTGIAGPGGGSPEKPVGTVWLAWAGPGWEKVELNQFGGDREAVRRQAARRILQGILEFADI